MIGESRVRLRRTFSRARNRWLAVLGLALLIGVGASVIVLTSSTTSGGVWDVSWRQCTSPGHTQSLPTAPTIGIVGVNGGRPFTGNPCLASELRWAGANAEVYINTNDPGPGVTPRWPSVAQQTPRPCTLTKPGGTTASIGCAYDYGWNEAADAVGRLQTALESMPGNPLSSRPLAWWLDVESANTWVASATLNTASINGAIDYIDAQHPASVGIYANASDSRTIFTSSSVFAPGTLSWLSTGETTLAGGLGHCAAPGFTRNGVALVQFLPSSPALDADARCLGYISGPLHQMAAAPLTGLTVNLTHAAPAGGLRLTLSSSSPAGRFSVTGPASASSPASVAVTVPAGTRTARFAYWDADAGVPMITADGPLGPIAGSVAIGAAP